MFLSCPEREWRLSCRHQHLTTWNPHTLSPDSLKAPCFPPTLCSPFTQQLLQPTEESGLQTLLHKKHKWTRNPHSLQLLGDIFLHLPWIIHSGTTSCPLQLLHTACVAGGLWPFQVAHLLCASLHRVADRLPAGNKTACSASVCWTASNVLLQSKFSITSSFAWRSLLHERVKPNYSLSCSSGN